MKESAFEDVLYGHIVAFRRASKGNGLYHHIFIYMEVGLPAPSVNKVILLNPSGKKDGDFVLLDLYAFWTIRTPFRAIEISSYDSDSLPGRVLDTR